jgi:hypothetical protein
MNFKTVSVIAAIAIASSMSAYAGETDERIAALEKEIAEIKKNQADMSQTIDVVETKTLVDKLNFSPELRLRMDSFKYKNNGIDNANWVSPASQAAQEDFTKKYDPALSARLRLNMSYDAGNDTKFVGRVGIHKNSQTNERVCIMHNAVSASPSAEVVFELDKAYVDHTFNKNGSIPVTGTFGILPTVGGSSSNIAEDKPRQSVFPSLIFDMSTYGVIATADLSKVTMDNTYMRAVVAKAYTQNKEQYYYQCNREVVKNGDVVGVYAETQIPGMGDNTVQVGFNMIKDLAASPFVGSNTLIDADTPKVLGDVYNTALNLEFRHIADSGLTAFASFGTSKLNGNGTSVDYTTANVAYGAKGIDYALGAMPDENGYAYHLGAQYALSGLGTKLGAEYNYGSQYWFSATQGSEDVFNKLSVHGDAFEVYAIQPISKELFVKIGYLNIQEDYTGSGWHFGTPLAKDGKTEDMYVILNAMF